MKTLISLLIGLLTFFFTLGLANKLIHWITSPIQSHDLQVVLVIVLWLICFSAVLSISILLGALVTTILRHLLGK